jgi:hypothetical protein
MAARTLRPDELAAAQQIFDNGLDFTRVRVSEGSQVPNMVGQIGALMRGKPAPQANAITVGNTSYFPRDLTSDIVDIAWLMHELTHQWQYQHFGIRYLAEAIAASTYVYCNPGEDPHTALIRCHTEGKTFGDFNREQQGDIVRDYYFAQKQATDPNTAQQILSAWDPYLQEIRQPKT